MLDSQRVGIGVIGLGPRARTLLPTLLELQAHDEIEVTAVCDVRQDRLDQYQALFDARGLKRPAAYLDYRLLLDDAKVDGVLAPTSWNSHLRIACDAMRKGKYVGIEVGGAASIDELWELVHASEATGVSCMMLENACYARNELMVMNMVRQGLFGELVYCSCGYEHDLRSELAPEYDARKERVVHNEFRNGDLYPTHGLGPIAKILGINRGNRFLTLTSHATKARGMSAAMMQQAGKAPHFNCGDMITTVIHCANGENITVTRSVSLPRPYSRSCRVQGTKGIWLEDAKCVFIEGMSTTRTEIDVAGAPYEVHEWTPIDDNLYEKFDHPIWQEYREHIFGGHNGMDALVLRAFADAIRRRRPTPIDVYDCAAWMCVTCLSEDSIAMGGHPVPVPDFTNGRWIEREPLSGGKWDL